jgi:hypothetical protein
LPDVAFRGVAPTVVVVPFTLWAICSLYGASIALVTVLDDATVWWMWFVPVYGNVRIFQESLWLGLYSVVERPLVLVLGWWLEEYGLEWD